MRHILCAALVITIASGHGAAAAGTSRRNAELRDQVSKKLELTWALKRRALRVSDKFVERLTQNGYIAGRHMAPALVNKAVDDTEALTTQAHQAQADLSRADKAWLWKGRHLARAARKLEDIDRELPAAQRAVEAAERRPEYMYTIANVAINRIDGLLRKDVGAASRERLRELRASVLKTSERLSGALRQGEATADLIRDARGDLHAVTAQVEHLEQSFR